MDHQPATSTLITGGPPTGAQSAPLIKGLNLPFVTVDLALRTDGQWRVVEIGDGQVSDYPATAPADALIAALSLNHG